MYIILHLIFKEGLESLKAIVGKMSKLKNEVQTDKVLLRLQDQLSDVSVWNDYLAQDIKKQEAAGSRSSWFCSSWLFTECYFYRRIKEAIELRYKDFSASGCEEVQHQVL